MTMFEIIIAGLIVDIIHDLIKHIVSMFAKMDET